MPCFLKHLHVPRPLHRHGRGCVVRHRRRSYHLSARPGHRLQLLNVLLTLPSAHQTAEAATTGPAGRSRAAEGPEQSGRARPEGAEGAGRRRQQSGTGKVARVSGSAQRVNP